MKRKKLGIREAVRLATNHSIGILESTDDEAFWGEDFWEAYEDQWRILHRARTIVINRIVTESRSTKGGQDGG